MLTFTPVTQRDIARLRRYYKSCEYELCEYSALVKLMWRSHLHPSWAEGAGCLIVRNRIDGEWAFDYPVPGPDGDVDAALTALESYCTDTETPRVISVVPEEKAPELLLRALHMGVLYGLPAGIAKKSWILLARCKRICAGLPKTGDAAATKQAIAPLAGRCRPVYNRK